MKKYLPYILTVIVVIVADQATKAAILATIETDPVHILPFFNFVLVWNRGISFGLFSQSHENAPIFLSVLSLAISAIMAFWIKREIATNKPLCFALSAVIGGALGNVIDRARFGAVVDFADFHIGNWHYPAFNIADSAIVLGIVFAAIDGLFLEQRRKKQGS